ncbi:hypothetical protein IC582_015528 [Cucumis melo]
MQVLFPPSEEQQWPNHSCISFENLTNIKPQLPLVLCFIVLLGNLASFSPSRKSKQRERLRFGSPTCFSRFSFLILDAAGATTRAVLERLFIVPYLFDWDGETVHGIGGGTRRRRKMGQEMKGKQVAMEEDIICRRQINGKGRRSWFVFVRRGRMERNCEGKFM